MALQSEKLEYENFGVYNVVTADSRQCAEQQPKVSLEICP